jgi:hypothetical protein
VGFLERRAVDDGRRIEDDEVAAKARFEDSARVVERESCDSPKASRRGRESGATSAGRSRRGLAFGDTLAKV